MLIVSVCPSWGMISSHVNIWPDLTWWAKPFDCAFKVKYTIDCLWTDEREISSWFESHVPVWIATVLTKGKVVTPTWEPGLHPAVHTTGHWILFICQKNTSWYRQPPCVPQYSFMMYRRLCHRTPRWIGQWWPLVSRKTVFHHSARSSEFQGFIVRMDNTYWTSLSCLAVRVDQRPWG